jgi:hypothetical protein
MIRSIVAVLSFGATASGMAGESTMVRSGAAVDTVMAGSRALDPRLLHSYALNRELVFTRGDSTRPFGRQSEQLTIDTLDGRPVLIHVVGFDTPAAVTLDSSWVDATTLSPIRMRSANRNRTVAVEFGAGTVRTTTTPARGAPHTEERSVEVSPFEWNMLPLVVSALPLRAGYRAVLPVFSDRSGGVVWYSVAVTADTFFTRSSGYRSPMWVLSATPDSTAPSVEWWVSQRHRFVDRSRVSEPGASMLYSRPGL